LENTKKLLALEERAKRMKVEWIDLSKYDLSSSLCENIPFTFARQHKVVPVKLENDELTVALEDPTALYVIEQLEIRTKHRIKTVLADTDEIMEAVEELYRDFTLQDLYVPRLSDKEFLPTLKMLKQGTIDFFMSILVNAIKRGATDVHLETFQKNFKVRYRIDGVISETVEVPRDMESQLSTLIKGLTRMKLEKRQIPQSGSFDIMLRDNPMMIRVGTLPTRYGERFILNIMDGRQLSRSLQDLGMGEDNLERIKKINGSRQGLVLISGPSGSGISTTLYSILREMSDPTRNIISIEDPIEGDLPGINQMEVNPKFDLDYPDCLRAVVSQDPDVIMVSRAMSSETVHLLIEASLTGQLVMAGLYAKDAINAITRLKDYGVEPYFITTSLIGVVSQRLARSVCPHCAEPLEDPPDSLMEEFKKNQIEGPYNLQAGKGCHHCLQTGFKGRLGLYEVLLVTETLRSMIMRGSIKARLQAEAERGGMKNLYRHGLEKVAQGLTTFEEIKRVLMD
jgi:type II secretory ATPase GspE/PulE/Tfp pilus assembly ATPase PilB-like protein